MHKVENKIKNALKNGDHMYIILALLYPHNFYTFYADEGIANAYRWLARSAEEEGYFLVTPDSQQGAKVPESAVYVFVETFYSDDAQIVFLCKKKKED
jgi:hypothetical protein